MDRTDYIMMVILVLACSVLTGITVKGCAETSFKEEAVKRSHAYWEANDRGYTTFKWKDGPKEHGE